MAERLALVPKMTLGFGENEDFALRFDPRDVFIAAGGYDGKVRVYSALSGQLHNELLHVAERTEFERVPMVTSLRWRGAGHLLISTHTDGAINYWRPASGRLVHQLTEEADIYALDVDAEGVGFATGSSDSKVRLYDGVKHCLVGALEPQGPQAPGHSSRVFSLKFSSDSRLLLSGGWDSTIHVWDTRTHRAIGALLGAYMCGDALDLKDDTVLAGSWQPKRQIQLYSLRMMSLLKAVPWAVHKGDLEDSCHVYSVQFAKTGPALILAAGSRNNEARFFEATGRNRPLAGIASVEKAIYSVDFANTSQKAALACGDGCIRILDYSFSET